MVNRDKFKNPDAIYRSAPFWALNDHLEPDELKRQINEFKKQGLGGAFLHPRGGMVTEYLSDEYFDAIRTCLDEFKKLNMVGWLYDEDRFPSGVAGGKVTSMNRDYRQKCLVPTVTTSREVVITDDTLALFLLKENSYERIEANNIPDNAKVLSVSVVESAKDSKFNNESYVDVLNKDAIEAFIDITHNKYHERFKDCFGKIIPAIFTDEPHFKNNFKGAIPWTQGLDLKFAEKFHYNLTDHLPALFFNIGDYQKIRFNYWDLISSMFVEAFSKKIYEWCEEKGIAYTGHFWEHVFPYPTYTGSVMPHYEYMQYPGIDMLFVADPNATEQYGNDFIVKEASSVANQLGKERVLSETHGASGWGLDLRYQKRAVDWQLALGINLFSLHLSLYSMKGYRKRDFPLSFLDHQPWWEDYKIMGDYMGRLCYALSQGKYLADVLVLHPSGSTWISYGSMECNSQLKALGDSVRMLTMHLNQLHVMYDLGDENILSRHGKVEKNILKVGRMNYKVVILPEIYLLRQSTFQLLKEFFENGGLIISTGQTPTFLDGLYSEELVKFFDNPSILRISNDKQALSDALYPLNIEMLHLEEINHNDLSSIYGHIRQDNNTKIIFICNLDPHQKAELRLKLKAPVKTERFDAETGDTQLCDVYSTGENEYYIPFTLDALNSVLFISDEKEHVVPEKPLVNQCANYKEVRQLTPDNWSVEILDYNAINLQFCRVSLNGEKYSEVDDVLALDDQIKDNLGMERGNIFSRQPWAYRDAEKYNNHFIVAEYPFFVENVPAGAVKAAVELPDLFTVYINNIKVNPTNLYYKDRAFRLYDIKPFIMRGKNVIRLESGNYNVLTNLESVYIVGDFRLVNINGRNYRLSGSQPGVQFAVDEVLPLHTGNVVEQGYPYYSGRIAYTADINIEPGFKKVILTLNGFEGVTASVKVNDVKVKVLGWKPYTANLTSFLKTGKNTITIEIANSLQNLLGPFAREANLNLVTPFSFYAKKHEQFLPVGFDGHAILLLS